MKKLTWALLSLMLFLGLGVAFAQKLPTPTLDPSGQPYSMVAPGAEIKITVPANFWDTYGQATLLYIFDEEGNSPTLTVTDEELAAWSKYMYNQGPKPETDYEMVIGVDISDAGDGSEIKWGPLTIPANASGQLYLYARLVDNSYSEIVYSDVVEAMYVVQGEAEKPDKPTFTPAGGNEVDPGTTVTITAEGADMIWYCTDCEDADFTQQGYEQGKCSEYENPIAILKAQTIKAVAVKGNYPPFTFSEVAEAAYTVSGKEQANVPILTINPAGPVQVEGSTIFSCTLDPNGYTHEEAKNQVGFTIKFKNGSEIENLEYQVGEEVDPDKWTAYDANQVLRSLRSGTAYAAAPTSASASGNQRMIAIEKTTVHYRLTLSETAPQEIIEAIFEAVGLNVMMGFVSWPSSYRPLAEASVKFQPAAPAPVVIPAPTLNPADGAEVAAGTKVTVTHGFEDAADVDAYQLYYVIDKPDFDFSEYENDDDLPSYMKECYGTITISAAMTVKVATAKVKQTMSGNMLTWSAPVTATYTIKADDPTPGNDIPAPVFNPDGGSIQAGTKILLTNGTEGDATPKPIYYNFKAAAAAETAFKSLTTKAALDKEVVNQTVSLRKANTYEAEGIELTADKTISAATADIDAAGNVTWSTIVTRSFTIGAAPTPGTKPAAPTFRPDGGAVEANERIAIETTTPGAKIYYINKATANFTSLTTKDDLDAEMSKTEQTVIVYDDNDRPILSDFQKEMPGDKCSISAAAVVVGADGTLTWSDVTTKEFTVKGGAAPDVEIPVITPGNDAAVHIGDMVTIECATDEAKIYYATDGTAPFTMDKDGYPVSVKEGALEYTEPFALTEEMLIKQNQVWAMKIRAVAAKGDAISPLGASAGYVVYPNAPTFDPVAGAVKEGTKVTISCVPTVADIYYTTDGTTPTMENSAKYESPIEITEAMTIKAIAVLGQYQTPASAAYTIGTPAEEVKLTFDPASGSEVEENTAVTITADREVEIFYMMFESKEAAEAAAWDQEKAESYSAEMKPVLSASKNTIKAAYAFEGAEAVSETFFYATYTVKALPAIELTFSPASGSEVEEGATVSVTASRETEIFYNVYADKASADADESFMTNAKEVKEDGMPVIRNGATYLRCAATDRGEMKYFDAAYKIKTANEGEELMGVTVYPNPSNGVFNLELPVASTIEVFMSNGTLYRCVKAQAGHATLNLNRSGIYFLRIAGEGRTAIKRVIVR